MTEFLYSRLEVGDPAPWFHQRSPSNPRFGFDMAAGRYVVLCFFMSVGNAAARAAMDAVAAHRQTFDDRRMSFFGVSIDPNDEKDARVGEYLPGIRVLWDFDRSVSRLYGAASKETKSPASGFSVRQQWVVLDPTLRVIAIFPFADRTPSAVFDFLAALPPADRFAGFEVQAPVLVLPNVFEPNLCNQLIDLYESGGGIESGFMREIDGLTVELHDHRHKRRRDHVIRQPDLIEKLQTAIRRKVAPEIMKVHCFKATRMERYIVACYAADESGHFRAHRDNRTKGTAHRRFAISINLNDDFEGGALNFPEYGSKSFKAPPGCAVVFSGSLLHAVSPVTAGKRYAFLPFLYDEEAAALREANARYLGSTPRVPA